MLQFVKLYFIKMFQERIRQTFPIYGSFGICSRASGPHVFSRSDDNDCSIRVFGFEVFVLLEYLNVVV